MKDPVTPLAAVAALFAAALFSPAAAETETPVVVELFTSQGCNSCPPADALLGELAGRDDVLPLSFHVTYWDRLGWPDTFGLEASTARQRAYAGTLGLPGLYTPQMVISGRLDVVGSQRDRVLRAIELLQAQPTDGPALSVQNGALTIGAGGGTKATIWLMAFDISREVAIKRGENRGRTLVYHHVVREVIELGRWTGQAARLVMPLDRLRREGRDAAAVLVQRATDGAIIGALRVDFED